MSIADNIHRIEKELAGTGARLVVVTKTHPVEKLQEAYDAGARMFGENRPQEMAAKQPNLPADVEWHLIGQLQTNKVKLLAPFVHTVQSIDSLKLLRELDKHAAAHHRVISGLLQFHIAQEETKSGLTLAEAEEILASAEYKQLKNVRLTGVMGVATFTPDETQLRQEFRQLRGYFEHLKAAYFVSEPVFCEISMGMSGDYPLAVAEGSTLVRVGSAIFGSRG
ncbi:YggS family pyridoxal phosphate-dependent enzyme [Hymenobacter sp. BT770]|uniref:YggS family pyridoxal phosphate-dependent enzyme n=1 Tax=Hymenobacter sp. BT770 TaxID=2886942 RepID=UPI001D128FF5|nr:YggS family pyridoxal phosphate-dependent enzyme [Hymenobacter sp. BT770]MCC3152341.1 YggS family pyridoxal phosphate-dependent enzyme [Hymenobacter sp. BT770]MDO3414154.1 YggS family pyridoxal phosphate-dependent enzyme [Hymenobacter sp. BT770]